jgi:anti-anti-sigma factor
MIANAWGPPSMLDIKKELREPGIAVLHLSGRIAMGRPCQDVEAQVDELLRQETLNIILDLTDVQRVDSTGFGTIVTCSQKVKKAGGTLRIVGASGMVEEIAQSSQLPRIIPFHSGLEEALAAFQKP